MAEPRHVQVTGALAPFAAGFEDDLDGRGYRSASDHLYVMAQLSCWLGREELEAADLTASDMERFAHWRTVAGYVSRLSLTRLFRLVDYLISIGVVSRFEPVVDDTPTGVLLDRYRRYLAEERGLSASSIRNYVEVARGFLAWLPADADFDAALLSTVEVTAFVLSECRRCKVASAKAMTTRLRSLLRFLYLVGVTGNDLSGAVPSVAHWRLASLPKAIGAGDVARVLGSCDRRRAMGRRDFAVMMVLSRLGLRAGEVAKLRLDSIDWRSGEVVIRGKGSRQDRLPLPVDVGEAIVGWLQRGRPGQGADRSLFTRLRAPLIGLSSGGISMIVRHACERAGLPPGGSHRLRHSAASGILQAGGSLAEVGEILRHERADTTSIYAKVDRRSLAAVVRPWPGGAA